VLLTPWSSWSTMKHRTTLLRPLSKPVKLKN